MSTESTARTPRPYRLVRLWVSTIVVFCMASTVGFARAGVVSRRSDLCPHPRGRPAKELRRLERGRGCALEKAPTRVGLPTQPFDTPRTDRFVEVLVRFQNRSR